MELEEVVGKILDKETGEVVGLSFHACLPGIQGAIKIDGKGDGFRLQLDVPQTEKEAILRLSDMTSQLLLVTVSALD